MKELIKKVKKIFGAEGESATIMESQSTTAGKKEVEESRVKKAGKTSALPPASQKREEIVRFIIHALKPYTNEKHTGIRGLRLFVVCQNGEEENLVNVALYGDRPKMFQEEVLERKLTDNYILPESQWTFEFQLVRYSLPDCQVASGDFGLNLIKDAVRKGKLTRAKLTIISGQGEKNAYELDPAIRLKYKIGRGANPALPSGMLHTNDIVFLSREEEGFDEQKGAANLSVSRYHAMIQFNPEQSKYYIAADKGGTPESGNKTKLFSENGKMTRLDIAGALHVLESGDQVEMGGGGRFLFETEFTTM